DMARLGDITRSDRPIQRELNPSIQPVLDSPSTDIQRQVISNDVESHNSPQIQRSNDNASLIQRASTSDQPIAETPDNQSTDINQVVQRQVDSDNLPNLTIVNNTPLESDRNIQASVNADYSAPIRDIAQDINLFQTDAIQRQTSDPNPMDRNQPDIAQLNDITQSDRTIQRESDFTAQPILDSQTTEIQRQVISKDIESNNSPQIQRSDDNASLIQRASTSDQP
ncbi:hypothetical protein, partial [Pseudanabaena sp. 'Roaring Creek']|uniref:hypothetical protein n=1 Tax=Pseudanabaena sp. 'Roaring Creek' TaxID=1681830 RepID=UPI000B23C398